MGGMSCRCADTHERGDRMQGGELFERLISSGPYSEHDACVALRKVAEALRYMHSKNVIHRDLKPENLLLTDHTDDADIKVADFGLSEVIQGAPLTRVCGTWAYSGTCSLRERHDTFQVLFADSLRSQLRKWLPVSGTD